MSSNNKLLHTDNVVGIIPCAGKGTRLGKLPFSKELFPVGQKMDDMKRVPKVVCDYLLDHMKSANVSNIHFVLRNGKWDIPAYYAGGKSHGFNPCYHIADYSYGVPFSVNKVFPFIKDKLVILGFPDILFRPKNAYQKLLQELYSNNEIDVILGVMPVLKPEKWDMVELDKFNNVKRLIIKSPEGKMMPFGWTIAAWRPSFSEFLNIRISHLLKSKSSKDLEKIEIYFGHIITDAIKMGLSVRSFIFDKGNCLDIGTPEDLNISKSFIKE